MWIYYYLKNIFLSLILKTKKKKKKEYLRKKEWQVQAETWKHHVSVARGDKSQPASHMALAESSRVPDL